MSDLFKLEIEIADQIVAPEIIWMDWNSHEAFLVDKDDQYLKVTVIPVHFSFTHRQLSKQELGQCFNKTLKIN